MFGPLLVLLLVVVILVVIPVSMSARSLAGAGGLGARGRAVRGQLIAAIGLMVVSVMLNEPSWLLHFLGPILAALIVVIGALITPQLGPVTPRAHQLPPARGSASPPGRLQVSLDDRSPWRIIPRWAYLIPAFGVILMAAAVVFFGLTSTTNDAGQYRVLDAALSVAQAGTDPQFMPIDLHPGGADEYPGWYAGIPVLILTLIMAAVTVAALYRIAHAPLRGTDEERSQDLARRRSYSLVVVAIASSGLLASLSVMSLYAAGAAEKIANLMLWDRNIGGVAYAFPALEGLAVLLYFAGLLAGGLAVGLAVVSWKVARHEPEH